MSEGNDCYFLFEGDNIYFDKKTSIVHSASVELMIYMAHLQ